MKVALRNNGEQHLSCALVWGLTLAFVLTLIAPALANELWVPPAKASLDKKVGNWAVANLGGETHFGFAVPDDMTGFTKAVVVLIPPKTGTLAYDLNIAVAENGDPHDLTTAVSAGLTQPVTAGQLTEIDVSSIFSGFSLMPGASYVSLNFLLSDRRATSQVVGLRFQYEAAAGLPQTCSNGQVAKFNAGNWACGNDNDTTYGAGTGLSLAGTTFSLDQTFTDNRYVNATGDTVSGNLTVTGTVSGNGSGLTSLNASNLSSGTVDPNRLSGTYNINISGSAVSFTGSLAGDVTGTQAATAVARLRGINVSSTAPTIGQVLKFDGTNWAPGADNAGVAGVTGVTASAPLTSSGGTTPNISLPNVTIGTYNTGIGTSALSSNTTGNYNTASGADALRSNTSGDENTASGLGALRSNTIGERNTASGVEALYGNTTGSYNTASGLAALRTNTTGSYNTASGALALYMNSGGSNNTASGQQALYSNTNGFDNTATGAVTLYSNTTGYRNTASGIWALYANTTGYENTASGVNALRNNTEGVRNTASGQQALYSNITGFQNTATGVQALYGNTYGTHNTATGMWALYPNTTGYDNTATGFGALSTNSTGFRNTASGKWALVSNITGANNTAIGYEADVSAGNLTNATAIGYGAIVNASNKVRLGNSSVTVIEGQVAYTFSSDKNQKENFWPVDGEEVLRKIRGLSVASWNYIGQDPKQFRHYGPVAQDFFAAFGNDGVGTIGTPTTINSGDMAGILMIAVQAQEKRAAELKEKVKTLKAENAELTTRLEALERAIRSYAVSTKGQ